MSSRAHRHVFVSRASGASDAHTTSSRSVSLVVGKAYARDGSLSCNTTSLRKFCVLGALVHAMLLATWWVRPPSMTNGVGNPTTVVKELSH